MTAVDALADIADAETVIFFVLFCGAKLPVYLAAGVGDADGQTAVPLVKLQRDPSFAVRRQPQAGLLGVVEKVIHQLAEIKVGNRKFFGQQTGYRQRNFLFIQL